MTHLKRQLQRIETLVFRLLNQKKIAMSGLNHNSGIHQLSPNCYPPSDSDDEDSFVVLSNSLGPDSVRDSVICTEPISANVIQVSLDSAVDALAINVAQRSDSLKESVTIGDAASQYASSIITPDEIQKKVDDLIAENTKLKDTLAQNNMAMKNQVDTLAEWQGKVLKVQDSHKEKFAEMKKYIDVLKAENTLLKNAASLSCTVDEESKFANHVMAMKSANQINKFELEAAQKKIEELQKALDYTCLENEKLNKNMAKQEDHILLDKINNLEQINAKIINDNQILQKRKDELEDSVNIFKEEKTHSPIISELENEIQQLRKINFNCAVDIKKLSDDHAIKQNKLFEEIAALKETNKEGLDKTRRQLMLSQMHITELKQQHVSEISQKDEQIKKLETCIKNLKVVDDEVTALRTQAALYKQDFEVEYNMKRELMEEKNKIAEDLHHLQRRNQQLLDEIDELRNGEFVHVSPAAPETFKFPCPRCSFKFKDVQSLENHVYRCMELEALP